MKTFCEEKITLPTLNIVRQMLTAERGMSLVVVIMLMVIILAITGAGLLFSSVELRVSGNYRVGTQAFYAADTGASTGFAQIVQDPFVSQTAIPRTDLGGGVAYCSGTIATSANCTTPKIISWQSIPRVGDQIPGGKGYTQSGWVDYNYQIDTTGIGPLGAAREVQALVVYGRLPN